MCKCLGGKPRGWPFTGSPPSTHNESEGRRWSAEVGTAPSHGAAAPSTDLEEFIWIGLSESTSVGTRKTVNYGCIGRSQGKLWWRLVAILTCKSFVKYDYRGERLIEQSSSWFPPKFPSG